MSAEIKSRRKVQWWYSTPKKIEEKKAVNSNPELDEGAHSAYMYRNLDW